MEDILKLHPQVVVNIASYRLDEEDVDKKRRALSEWSYYASHDESGDMELTNYIDGALLNDNDVSTVYQELITTAGGSFPDAITTLDKKIAQNRRLMLRSTAESLAKSYYGDGKIAAVIERAMEEHKWIERTPYIQLDDITIAPLGKIDDKEYFMASYYYNIEGISGTIYHRVTNDILQVRPNNDVTTCSASFGTGDYKSLETSKRYNARAIKRYKDNDFKRDYCCF